MFCKSQAISSFVKSVVGELSVRKNIVSTEFSHRNFDILMFLKTSNCIIVFFISLIQTLLKMMLEHKWSII